MSWDDFEAEALAMIDAIGVSMDTRLAEFEQSRDVARLAAASGGSVRGDLAAVARGETALTFAQSYLGEAHLQAVKLTHDLEVAVSDRFLRRLVDLDEVFPPSDFPLNAHNTVRAAQSGVAKSALQGTPPCKVLPTSHLALDLSIAISVLGQTVAPDFFLPFQVVRPQQPSWTRKFAVVPGRGPQICPPDGLSNLFSSGTIERRVREEVLAASQTHPPFDIDVSVFDDLIGPSYLYAGLVTANIAFFGVARDRARTALAPLARLPEWATAGLKVHQSLLAVRVMAEAPKGARLTHFDADTGTQLFRFGLAMEHEKSWGNDLVRVSVAVRVTGDFHLKFNPVQPNHLRIASVQVGALRIDRTKVDTKVLNTKVDLPGVDDIIERLAREIAQGLVGFLGRYDYSIDQFIPECRRLSCTVLPEAVVLHIST